MVIDSVRILKQWLPASFLVSFPFVPNSERAVIPILVAGDGCGKRRPKGQPSRTEGLIQRLPQYLTVFRENSASAGPARE